MPSPFIQPGDNPDITKERQATTFDVDKMAAFIWENEQVLQRRREIIDYVEKTPQLHDPIPVEFMSREEKVMNNARKIVYMTDNVDVIDASDFFGEGMLLQSLVMGRDFHAMSLHYTMFFPTLQGQCDEEQLEQWLGLTVARGIIGTYAQTELGHGTNLQKLETTATYDPKTEEFVIHSPTITAAKWWPGGLGKSSNCAIVVANLYTQGECKGPHPFIVQLRDFETHQPLPGIRIGDIGPKFGINGNDNGFLLFDNFRVPRRAMLMRHSRVEKDGTYVKPKHSKLAFGTMVFVRSIMIKDQATQLAAAATIAIRYSAIRRQGEKEPGKGEVQILDYQTQQFRLFPQLARALAFLFAAYEIRDIYKKVTEQLTQGNTELLPELHALSSGLKSVVSWDVAQGIEQCRLSCGGHGYSQASGLPEMYAFAVGGCTYEGENIVMLLQVARSLMKEAEEVRNGKANLADICHYIGEKGDEHSRFTIWRTYSDADIVHDCQAVARRQVFRAYDLLKRNQRETTQEEAWNWTSIELAKAARFHVRLYLVKTFLRRVSTLTDQSLRTPLTDLTRLYAFDLITHAHGDFTRGGFMSDRQIDGIKEGLYACLRRIRPNAVNLVDAFNFADRELHSVLGRRDGNVYSSLLEWAQNSQLNRTEVLSTFDKYLGPMMKEGRSKL